MRFRDLTVATAPHLRHAYLPTKDYSKSTASVSHPWYNCWWRIMGRQLMGRQSGEQYQQQLHKPRGVGSVRSSKVPTLRDFYHVPAAAANWTESSREVGAALQRSTRVAHKPESRFPNARYSKNNRLSARCLFSWPNSAESPSNFKSHANNSI